MLENFVFSCWRHLHIFDHVSAMKINCDDRVMLYLLYPIVYIFL